MIEANYNRDLDILTVEEADYSDYDRSMERGGFIIDLDSQSDFLGIEILDASQKINLSRDELVSVTAATVDVETEPEQLEVKLTLAMEDGEHVIRREYPPQAVA